MSRSATFRVVLSGWYGAVNLGDELLLETIARWVREAGAEPVALSVHPEHTRAVSGIAAVPYADASAIGAELASAGLFVLGGGGLFQDYDGFDAARASTFPASGPVLFAQHFAMARAHGVPTLALAQGVGPLRDAAARAMVADLFERANGVSLRDDASAALLRVCGVTRELPVAPDPGWSHVVEPLLAGLPEQRWSELRGRPLLAVVLRHWPYTQGWEDDFAAAFRGAVPADWACVWLDFSRAPPEAEPGSEIARRMIARLNDDAVHVVWEGGTPAEAAAMIARCDACLAMRLHGLLLALAAGRPAAAIEYDGKVSALAASLGIGETQRVPIDAIRERLPAALDALTNGTAKRLDERERSALRRDSLAHRALLHEALRLARGRRM